MLVLRLSAAWCLLLLGAITPAQGREGLKFMPPAQLDAGIAPPIRDAISARFCWNKHDPDGCRTGEANTAVAIINPTHSATGSYLVLRFVAGGSCGNYDYDVYRRVVRNGLYPLASGKLPCANDIAFVPDQPTLSFVLYGVRGDDESVTYAQRFYEDEVWSWSITKWTLTSVIGRFYVFDETLKPFVRPTASDPWSH